MHSDGSSIGKQRLSEWVYTAECAGLKEIDACTKAVHNRSDEILNSFDCVFTNGFTEGCNTISLYDLRFARLVMFVNPKVSQSLSRK